MPSKITLKFSSRPANDTFIMFNPSFNTKETFKPNRLQAYQVRNASTETIFQLALNFKNAFDADYNARGGTTFELDNSNSGYTLLTITALDTENLYDNAYSTAGTAVTIESIVNTPAADTLKLVSHNYSTSSNQPCYLVDLNITMNKPAGTVKIWSSTGSYRTINVTTNTFTINDYRGTKLTLEFYDGGAFRQYFLPPNRYEIPEVEQRLTPNGYVAEAKVSKHGLSPLSLGLRYSLDGVTFKTSPSFDGILVGDYTMYVQDDFGCNQNLNFSIVDDESSAERLTPYFLYPELNSISLAIQKEKQYKNFDNTLSVEEEGLNFKDFFHLIEKNDVVRCQFRSTYDDYQLKMKDCQGTEVLVPVEKVSNNTNIFDSRDGLLKIYNDNYVGVYLDGGKTYDANLNATGFSGYSKKLPPYYKNNGFIKLNNIGWYQITEIFFDEEVSAYVALTNYRADSVSQDFVIVTYNYNQLPYEVYEFEIDFTSYEGIYYLQLDVTGFGETFCLISERLDVREKHERVFEIRASNTENNRVNYQTGIQHLLRLPYVRQKTIAPETNVEINRTDSKITHLNGEVTDNYSFEFMPIPGAMIRKLSRILVLDRVFIDGKNYIQPEFDSEPLGSTNKYDLTVTMKPNTNLFSSGSQRRVANNIETGGFLQISEGGGFLKHGY
ncbi:hypothetical protein ACJRPK_13815 [Aquimarina sp. 2-A2]|uniref:hypothetical protein n=1 Tax=Aquimarina sp. 2-A2 TaxID=3382644 RepID=UPI00387F0F64